ncbi:MAG TPA: lipopolysaccharide biosynthesis protein [Pseudoduganella sp.]
MAIEAQILTGLKWTAGARFGGQLLTWAISILVMRLLQPADYGLVAMASVAIVFLNVFAEVGLGTALVQATEVGVLQMRQAYGIFFVLNGTLCAAVNLATPFLSAFYGEPRLSPVLHALSLQFLLAPFGSVCDIQLQRALEYKRRSLIELSTALITSVSTLLMALAGAGVWALVWPTIIGACWRAAAFNLAAPFPHWPEFRFQGMRRLLTFGGTVTLSRLMWTFFMQVDVVIVGRVLGRDVLGLYSVAMHLATLPVQRVTAIVNQVAFPALARIQQEREMLKEKLVRVIAMMSLLAIPILWGLSATAKEVVLVVLGASWVNAIFPLQALTLMMPFRTLIGFLPTVTDAIGRPEIAVQNMLLAIVVMPPAFYVGSRWGINGVAMAWLLAYPLVLLVNAQRMLGAVGIRLGQLALPVARPVACGLLMYMAVSLTRLVLPGVDNRLLLATEIIVGAVTYLSAAWIGNRAAFKDLLKMMGLNK